MKQNTLILTELTAYVNHFWYGTEHVGQDLTEKENFQPTAWRMVSTIGKGK